MNHSFRKRKVSLAVLLIVTVITRARTACAQDVVKTTPAPVNAPAPRHVRICSIGLSGAGYGYMTAGMLQFKAWTVDYKFVIGRTTIGYYPLLKDQIEAANAFKHNDVSKWGPLLTKAVTEFNAGQPIDYITFMGMPFADPSFDIEPRKCLRKPAISTSLRPGPISFHLCRVVV